MNTAKSLIVTTPIRPRPTSTPPFGSLAIVNYLHKKGVENCEFYNIDGMRPDHSEVLRFIAEYRPQVIGISAVVSTAYGYTKKLVQDVKALLPDTLVVVGGNLAASAEVLLRRAGVDMCVTGEGEQVFLEIVQRAATTLNAAEFADIPGLVLLDKQGNLISSGYPAPLESTDVFDICWDDLSRNGGDLDVYIYDPLQPGDEEYWLVHDPRAQEAQRQGKRMAVIRASKGCVARCTFCHRFDKGIRYLPVPLIMERIRLLMERFNVGFINVGDENFGTDRRWLAEFCGQIKELDVLWRVTGMRVNCITPEQLKMMREAGCTTVLFGMETGSERMLRIMEKKVRLEDNYNAMRWTVEAGIHTVVQLVVGMPGEMRETILETTDFCKFAMTLSPEQNPNDLSINYAQALPGTPLYEFGRARGLIAGGLDGEEAYLLRISDRDAHDELTTLNFTDEARLECQMWRPMIQIAVNYEYVRKFGIAHYRRILLNDTNYFQQARPERGYFANPHRLVERGLAVDGVHDTRQAEIIDDKEKLPSLRSLIKRRQFGLALICYPVLAYRLRSLLVFLVLFKAARSGGVGYAWDLLTEWLTSRIGRRRTGMIDEYLSLRKIVDSDGTAWQDEPEAIVPLRRGR